MSSGFGFITVNIKLFYVISINLSYFSLKFLFYIKLKYLKNIVLAVILSENNLKINLKI